LLLASLFVGKQASQYYIQFFVCMYSWARYWKQNCLWNISNNFKVQYTSLSKAYNLLHAANFLQVFTNVHTQPNNIQTHIAYIIIPVLWI